MILRSLGAVLVLAGLLFSAQPAAAEPVRIAVLPIVVHSDGGHDYLRAGLADMLTARLEQMPGVRVVRVDDPEAATTELSAARELAQARGATHVLFGSFTSFGDGASLDMQCAPAGSGGEGRGNGGAGGDGEPVRQVFIQSGSPGELIPRLDELADKVARYVLEGPPAAAAGAAAAGGADGGGAGAAGGTAPADGSVDALRRRIEALERAVYEAHPEERAERAAEPAPAGTSQPSPAGADDPAAADRSDRLR